MFKFFFSLFVVWIQKETTDFLFVENKTLIQSLRVKGRIQSCGFIVFSNIRIVGYFRLGLMSDPQG